MAALEPCTSTVSLRYRPRGGADSFWGAPATPPRAAHHTGRAMGLFKKKDSGPRAVGQALVLLDDDGWAFVNQQHHPNMDPDIIALLAPITFVIVEASRLLHRGPEHVSRWLATAGHQAEADPDAVNRHHNPGGVAPLQDTAAGVLTGMWDALDGYASDRHRDRILGALMAAAHWRNVADALPHAMEALKVPGVQFNHPATFADLPQLALDYGIQQAALAGLQRYQPWGDGPGNGLGGG
jgi:hypothetical protein